MKTRPIELGAILLLLWLCHAPASVLYVDLNCTNPVPPYAGWNAAATNIQDAIDAANPGDQILVTNGVYQNGGRAINSMDATNRITVTKHITIQSVNGPTLTIIEGYQVPGTLIGTNAVRCAYLTNGAMIAGFTLTNGACGISNYAYGGGILCASTSEVVSNCILTGNTATTGGGAAFGTLLNCVVTSNHTQYGNGGGAYKSILFNCLIAGNSASEEDLNSGGGADACVLTGCTIVSNSANSYGGGAYLSTLTNCVVVGNTAFEGGGVLNSTAEGSTFAYNGAQNGAGAFNSTLNNCLVVSNTASVSGGGICFGNLNNCTLVYNNCGFWGYGYGSGAEASMYTAVNLANCIVYDNVGLNYSSYVYFSYCCTTPLPSGGVGNITNDPVFIDQMSGNFRLQTNSPCINSGNNAYVVGSTDLDGRPRVVSGIVDMGAYEFQGPGMGEFIAWLQQYGLPTDGSVDYLDSDGTGMNNWQKWIAGLNPTDPTSVLAMLPPAATTNSMGVTVSWQSVNTRTYYLQRATDLTAQPAFSSIQSNIVGQAGTTSYTDTTATNGGPYFYRVGVQ